MISYHLGLHRPAAADIGHEEFTNREDGATDFTILRIGHVSLYIHRDAEGAAMLAALAETVAELADWIDPDPEPTDLTARIAKSEQHDVAVVA